MEIKHTRILNKEVEAWRTGASIAWAAIVTPFCSVLCLALATFNIFHPITWFYGCLVSCFDLRNWFLIAIICLIVCLVAISDAKLFSVKPLVLTTHLQYAWQILNPHSLAQTLGHGMAAGLVVFLCTKMVGNDMDLLTVECLIEDKETTCLNEHHVFLVFFGVLMGFIFMFHFHVTDQGLLAFPLIQQEKFFKVKSQLPDVFLRSFTHVFKLLIIYSFLYYLFIGQVSKDLFYNLLSVKERPDYKVDSLSGILDFGLLWYALLFTTLGHFLFSISALLYSIYHTQPRSFLIEAHQLEDKEIVLCDILDQTNYPLTQYLGFMDLYELSKFSSQRRQEIFSLSQPGGHPRNWDSIIGKCLSVLRSFTNDLQHFNDGIMSNGSTKPSPSDSGTLPNKSILIRFKEDIWKTKALSFLTKPLLDSKSAALYRDCQIYIWIVDAISNLVAASYSEDKFGVVQRSLKDIISTLLSLQECVDKQLKLAPPNLGRKTTKTRQMPHNVAQRYLLKTANRSAIYRIILTFDEHIKTLGLSTEQMRKVQLYQEFKE